MFFVLKILLELIEPLVPESLIFMNPDCDFFEGRAP